MDPASICTFCGDPSTGLCQRMHRDWTIIHPLDLALNDIIRPDGKKDGTLYTVSEINIRSDDPDAVLIETKQGRRFTIRYLGLPILVKRLVLCEWPRCDLHCQKCMRFAELEQMHEHLLGMSQSANAKRRKRAVDKREEHERIKNRERAKNQHGIRCLPTQ